VKYLLDVNVIVAVLRSDAHGHDAARQWFHSTGGVSTRVMVLPETLTAAVRILTNPRIWEQTSTTRESTVAVQALVDGAMLDVVGSSAAAWDAFADMVASVDVHHRDVPDALLAAQAVALDAEVVTFDRGLRAYPGLRSRVL